MPGDCRETDAVDIIDGCREGCYIDEVRGAGLEFEGEFGICGFLEADMGNHFTSPLVGGHGFEPPFFAIKHPYTGRAIHFV